MDTTQTIRHRASSIERPARYPLPPAPCILHPRRAFTLVELLVVIVIIGILVGLITVAAIGAMRAGQRTRIKVEIDNMSGAFETYRDTNNAYPPNAQTDDTNFAGGAEPPATPISESQVLNDFRNHLKQISPRLQEPDTLLRAILGDPAVIGSGPSQVLQGGMSAGEALVFWLSGFSSDPRYPISGEGGPSYDVTGISDPNERRAMDPIESRNWVFPFAVPQLQPRNADDGYFDHSDGRFIEYTVTINGQTRTRRINFWQYMPRGSQQPYLYFDVSRHPAAVLTGSTLTAPFDPPAATLGANALPVFAIKKRSESLGGGVPIEFANAGKFQILHCGIDDRWGEEAFARMSVFGVTQLLDPPQSPAELSSYLLFPDGPFTGDIADTLTNFTTGTLEDSQP